ncbi:MAG TPA: hypothetical protein VG371_01310 [Solirubrobacteraceae bacterium]|jgi:hypothetical protein|nr:hypothetical protein [Solirubrobacteraceae bacterium]
MATKTGWVWHERFAWHDARIPIAPRPASDEELTSLRSREYVDRIRADSADRGGDAGGSSPFGRWTYEISPRTRVVHHRLV